MSKIKPILPSLRERKRYLAFEILSKDRLREFSLVSKALWHSCLRFMGEMECARAGIWILPDKYNSRLQRGLIRVGNSHVDNLKSALLFVDDIDGHHAIMRSIGVSGILRKAEEKYLVA